MPGIGLSIFIGAVGAILRYAVTAQANGFDVHMAGNILMIVGLIGLVLSLLFWASFSPFGRGATTRRTEERIVSDGVEQAHVVREVRDDVR